MAITVNPYLNFAGNTREAMTYYQGIFGGELVISTFADYGMDHMPADGVMHARLSNGVLTLMASDAMPGAEATWGGTRNYIAFMGDDVETMTLWYEALAADGTPGMPLARQVWGDMYGDVKDKYGIEWMVNISAAQGDSTNAPEGGETSA